MIDMALVLRCPTNTPPNSTKNRCGHRIVAYATYTNQPNPTFLKKKNFDVELTKFQGKLLTCQWLHLLSFNRPEQTSCSVRPVDTMLAN